MSKKILYTKINDLGSLSAPVVIPKIYAILIQISGGVLRRAKNNKGIPYEIRNHR